MGILGKKDGVDRKTEHLNLRIDAKLDFAVWFAAQAAEQKKTEWAESALKKAADETADANGKTWRKYWDASEGVRTLNLLRWGAFETDVEDDRLIEFVRAHGAFFFHDDAHEQINVAAVNVLWDGVEAMSREWYDTRRADYWAVGYRLLEQLKIAGVACGYWPPPSAERQPEL